MKVRIADIQKTLVSILMKKGLAKADAAIVADEHIEGESQGKVSHGLIAFPSVAKKLMRRAKPKVLKRTHSLIFIDAQSNFGAVVGRKYIGQAITMAKKEGVSAMFIKDMATWLRPETLARYLADKRLIGLVMNHGGAAAITSPDGFEPLLGTNPIGIGIPTSSDPIVVDMATAKRAWGVVRVAKQWGGKLPPHTYLDRRGKYTRDPYQAYSVEAFGGHKGFALALLVEVMTGSLVRMAMSRGALNKMKHPSSLRGAFVLIIDPRMLTQLSKFEQANTQLVQAIRHSKQRRAKVAVSVPGDSATALRKKNLKAGYLELKPQLWNSIKALQGI